MKNDDSLKKAVAVLVTGNEVVNGDISDDNGQTIANFLIDHNIKNGLRLFCHDNLYYLKQALLFLLRYHDIIITSGGLGPTSDDITRFALAEALDQPLVFNESAWQHIKNRFTKKQKIPPKTNRQQAMFPLDATLIINPYGTACGCKIEKDQKLIFMLPGPPKECLPLFKDHVICELIHNNLQQPVFERQWLLKDIGESYLSEIIDPLMTNQRCEIHYRAMTSSIKLSLKSHDQPSLTVLANQIEALISAYVC